MHPLLYYPIVSCIPVRLPYIALYLASIPYNPFIVTFFAHKDHNLHRPHDDKDIYLSFHMAAAAGKHNSAANLSY